jgi:hypothetical protein
MTSRNGERPMPMTATDAPNLSSRLTPYARDDRSVAIVGACDRKASFGNPAIEKLADLRWAGASGECARNVGGRYEKQTCVLEPTNVRLAPIVLKKSFSLMT